MGFAKACTYFAKTCEACAALMDATTNQDEFVHEALELCVYPEDRVAMCALLEVEYIPLPPKKDMPRPKPKRLTLSSGLGATTGKATGW